jgi:hypothetical protein
MDIYTINFDSTNALSNTQFKVSMRNIIKNIVKIEVLAVSVQPGTFQNILYLYIPQLQSIYTTSADDNSQKSASILAWTPDFSATKFYLDGIGTPSLRTNFNENMHFKAMTIYKVAIGRLGVFDVNILGQDGNLLDTSNTGTTYITMRFFSETAIPLPLPETTTYQPLPTPMPKAENYNTTQPKFKIPIYFFAALLAIVALFMNFGRTTPLQ